MMKLTKPMLIGLVLVMFGRAYAAGSLTSTCVNKTTGAVRVLITGGTCSASEVPITWGHEAVDSRGNLIGALDSTGSILHQINGIWFGLPIDTGGFVLTGGASAVEYEYTTTNCSGTTFIHGGDLIEEPAIFGASQAGAYIQYGKPPFSSITVRSTKCEGGSCGNTNNVCENFGAFNDATAGVMSIFNLSGLGLTPPFSVQ